MTVGCTGGGYRGLKPGTPTSCPRGPKCLTQWAPLAAMPNFATRGRSFSMGVATESYPAQPHAALFHPTPPVLICSQARKARLISMPRYTLLIPPHPDVNTLRLAHPVARVAVRFARAGLWLVAAGIIPFIRWDPPRFGFVSSIGPEIVGRHD